jgi:predicted RND superfamily exporter protein
MLLNQTEQSVWFAMSTTASPEELLRRKEQFEKLPSVDRTEEIVSILPADVSAKEPIIARIGQRLANAPEMAPMIPVARPADLAGALAAVQAMLPAGRETEALRKSLTPARENLSHLSERETYQRLSSFQQQAAADLVGQLQALKSVSHPTPPALTDLPPALVTRFVGQQGRHLLKIYGKGDIWDMAGLAQFVAQVKSVDPGATGQPLQTFYASRQMQRSYLSAALYALVAVTILLMLDFRDLGMALLALLPVALGTLQLFGLMGLLGVTLNPANMIVLPLILGIGVDYGVHIVHDYRQQRGRYEPNASLTTAMVITALTTTVGFGALMIASHRGLASLGRVMTLGVTFCLLSSLLTLPAVLSWLSRFRAVKAVEDESAEPEELETPRRAA